MELKINVNEYSIINQLIEFLKNEAIFTDDINKDDKAKLLEVITNKFKRDVKSYLYTKEELRQMYGERGIKHD
jgi:hypothetical protein